MSDATVNKTFAIVEGNLLENLPTDLYVPPDALQVFLESFEGPLDLLLYLIQRQNLDILNIPIADITHQYIKYIELMQNLNLDLAAEYLVIAATLMEIKSRFLLPTNSDLTAEIDDPRTKLIKQLREYAQYKQAAQDLNALPRMERDIFMVAVEPPDIPREVLIPEISWSELLDAIRDVMQRASFCSSHQVIHEPLSVRERMSLILAQLKINKKLDFYHFFDLAEGRAGVVVTFIAILELTKESLIVILQPNPFEKIEIVGL
ncbi:MAG: segregation/condensation protein A [Thiomargarita sp.]|nr:segregation/condensation protein A [Thiomargarita sp.]